MSEQHPHVSARQAAVLDAMAEHVLVVVRAWDDAYREAGWEPKPGSVCEWEREQLRRKRGPGMDWDDRASVNAVGMANSLLAIAAQQLRGTAALLQVREVIFPIAPLVRSVFETSAYVAWLLDPRAVVRERAARSFLAQVDDVTKGKAAAKLLDQPLLNTFGDALHRLRKVELGERFFPSEIERSPDGALTIAAQRYPGLSASMTILDAVHGHDWNSPGMYAWLGNVSHPTANVLLVLAAPEGDGEAWRFQVPDAGYPYKICRAGLLAFVRGWGLLAAYLGKNQAPIQTLAERIDDLPAA